MKTIIRLLASIAAIACVTVGVIRSQSLELKPGYIAGTVTVAGETINSMNVYANWQSQSATSSHSSGNYTTTVNVPAGTSPVYSVRPTASMNFGSDDYLELPTQNVAVAENQTSTLNFSVTPAYVSGSITVQNGTLNYAYIYAQSPSGRVVRAHVYRRDGSA